MKNKSKSIILHLVYYSPFLVAAFTASLGFKTFQSSQFAIAALYLLSFNQAAIQISRKAKWFAGAYLLISGVLFATLQQTNEHKQIFPILVIFSIAHVVCFSLKVSTSQQLIISCIARIIATSSLALLGAMTQSPAEVWGILILGYIPGCILAAVDLLKSANVLSKAGWSRITKTKKGEIEIVRPGSVTRGLSTLLVIGPGLVLLFLPFGLVPSAVLLIAILFYPALNIVQDFQSSTQDDSNICRRTEKAAILAAVIMPIIAGLSIGLISF